MIYEISLFSGAGGGLLASKILGWRTVLYVENDDDRQEKIRRRIRDGILDDAPIWDDVRTLGEREFGLYRKLARRVPVVVTGGPPCQPSSIAGDRRGEDDERWLWWDALRVCGIVRPWRIFLENPAGFASLRDGRDGNGNLLIGKVFWKLAEIGYDARSVTLSAAAVGAQHERSRVWIIAYPNSK